MAALKKVLFLLSGNISTTPRAQKVLELLEARNISVDIVMFNRGEKWNNLDRQYLSTHNTNYLYLPFTKNDNLIIRGISSLLNKICDAINCRTIETRAIASSKINSTFRLCLNRISDNGYDFVYGFSSMLWPAYYIADKWGVPFAFDMEDYHPMENIYHSNKQIEKKRREQMLIDLLPKAKFVTYAAPLIKAKSDECLSRHGLSTQQGKVINNTFKTSDFHYTEYTGPKIQFIWFSQTVSYERGLEQILPALTKYKDQIHLTIIGNMDNDFYNKVLRQYPDLLTIMPAMEQKELHNELCKYDVGLAIELSTQNKDNGNRELCLTNKIFSYMLAGLYIIATDTKAQGEFIHTHPSHGVISEQTTEKMGIATERIIHDIDVIRAQKRERFANAQKHGWETEQNKLIELLNTL